MTINDLNKMYEPAYQELDEKLALGKITSQEYYKYKSQVDFNYSLDVAEAVS